MYTIKQVSELLSLSIHTLRYYTDLDLVPDVQRDKNNRRLFNESSIEWLRGIKYLRQCGMSIESIRDYCILCQQDGDEAIQKRYQIILEQKEIAKAQLKEAQRRVNYLTKKADHELEILNHHISDDKNPSKKAK